jgi:hypothetical protein
MRSVSAFVVVVLTAGCSGASQTVPTSVTTVPLTQAATTAAPSTSLPITADEWPASVRMWVGDDVIETTSAATVAESSVQMRIAWSRSVPGARCHLLTIDGRNSEMCTKGGPTLNSDGWRIVSDSRTWIVGGLGDHPTELMSVSGARDFALMPAAEMNTGFLVAAFDGELPSISTIESRRTPPAQPEVVSTLEVGLGIFVERSTPIIRDANGISIGGAWFVVHARADGDAVSVTLTQDNGIAAVAEAPLDRTTWVHVTNGLGVLVTPDEGSAADVTFSDGYEITVPMVRCEPCRASIGFAPALPTNPDHAGIGQRVPVDATAMVSIDGATPVTADFLVAPLL